MPALSKGEETKSGKKLICFLVALALMFTAFSAVHPARAAEFQWEEDGNGWRYRNADGTYALPLP